jgi:aryl-alcohol dehydrogenase-like predicted oxidoreductase
LGGGLLTGKYGVNKRPEQGRLVENQRYTDRYGRESDFVTAEKFTELAKEMDVKPATLAVAWVMANPAITAPIVGARSLSQLEDSLAALEINMNRDLREKISALSQTPAPATDRTETLVSSKWT